MVSADEYFNKEAEEATRSGSEWEYSSERSYLQSVMNELAAGNKKVADVQIKSAQQQSSAMQYLQMQQQQIQQL